MIPIKIQIKNFLSYGADLQTVDFSPYHLLCLSGKNGHGKSALLDAITWAIWGQARKTSGVTKADHGLLRLGQTHMLVIIDFECNNNHYRIRREFALTHGKPYAAVDFGIVNAEDDSIIPLTEKKIRDTQQKIEDTIHLDYDSFVNSAFLRQGHANEFSKKSAKDRKEILANILGLQRYETMRKAANDKAREAIAQKQQLIALQEKITQELEKTEQIKTDLQQIKTTLTDHEKYEKQFHEEQQKLQKERETLLKKQEANKQCGKALQEAEKERLHHQAELRNAFTQWRTIHKQQLNSASPEALKKEKEQCAQEIQKWQDAFAKKLEKKEQYLKEKEIFSQLEQQLQLEQSKQIQKAELQLQQMHMEHKQYEQQLQTVQKDEIQLKAELTRTEQNIKTLEIKLKNQDTKKLAIVEKQFEKRRNHYQQWITQANYLKSELEQIKQKKQFVHDESAPSCPLCEQNLSASRKKFLKSKLGHSEAYLMHRHKRLSRLIHILKPLLIEQHTQLEHLKKEQTNIQVEQHQKQEAEKQLASMQTHLKKIQNQCLELTQLIEVTRKKITLQQEAGKTLQQSTRKAILEHAEYQRQYQSLQTIQKTFNEIVYDQAQHKKVTERLQTIEKLLTSFDTLQKEALMQDERKRTIGSLCVHLKKINSLLQQLITEQKTFANLELQEKAHLQQEVLLREKQIANNAQKDTLLQQKGRLEQQYSMLKKLKVEQKEQAQIVKTLTLTADDFQAIATAMGKNGIQALLIEDAIPEIEQEANSLLGKLTDNQAQIFIESLRDLKSGGTRETLDIKISDAAGVRPYEMFSGGEAFRIDFALRIAISKLLARRAGTSLQTLIIDEGFGSQDDEGLNHIMDAIYKIQDDFKKVIIVSHLPRLKDQFPVHFCIQKGPHGSHVDIIEQA
ncbi:MAG: SMC family ATPase [Candidatus Dependentiae bacterium]